MIDDSVKIGSNVKIGEHVIIGENVEIGNNVSIGHHVVINRDTCIGDRVVINESTYLGRVPAANKSMAHRPAKELPPLLIFDDVKIGNHCVIYQGSTIMEGVLIGRSEERRVGKECRMRVEPDAKW